jgi:ketosteroid isomerase-like protein
MSRETEEFLAATMPRLNEVEIALHNGDAVPRKGMWSHHDPVTLFGAAFTGDGWSEVGPIFDRLASSFSNCESFDLRVVAAEASGDHAYIVAEEHTTASINGAPTETSVLRVTEIFRREDGAWKVVHRHGDSPENAKAVAARMAAGARHSAPTR